MDLSLGSLVPAPVHYPVALSRASSPREGELLLASDSNRGGRSRRQPLANVALLVVSLQARDVDKAASARPVEPAPRAERASADATIRRGLAAYEQVLTLDTPRTRGFYAVA